MGQTCQVVVANNPANSPTCLSLGIIADLLYDKSMSFPSFPVQLVSTITNSGHHFLSPPLLTGTSPSSSSLTFSYLSPRGSLSPAPSPPVSLLSLFVWVSVVAATEESEINFFAVSECFFCVTQLVSVELLSMLRTFFQCLCAS